MSHPLDRLRYHVSGAIERGEKEPIIAQENTKMTHTPGPWRWKDTLTGCVIKSKDGQELAILPVYSGLDFSETQGNAQHIVHCVNTHDALVEALSNLIADWERVHGPMPVDHEAHIALRLAKEGV